MTIYQWFNHDELYISNESHATVGINENIQFILSSNQQDISLKLLSSEHQIFLNGRLLSQGEYSVIPGSVLKFLNYEWRIFNDEIHCLLGKITHTALPEVNYSHHDLPKEYPNYHRSPRLIYREPDDEISIDYPPQEIKQNSVMSDQEL